MADESFSVQVDPGEELRKAIRAALREVDDLTIPLTLISQSWYKTNKAIFALKSPGKYADLSSRRFFAWWEAKGSPLRKWYEGGYKEYKLAKVGFVYPILKRTGRLEGSITNPTHPETISSILNRKVLLLGSRVDYGRYHQTGTKKMPARPFLLIGPEQVAPQGINNREKAWTNILKNYVRDVTAKSGVGKAP